MASGLVIQDATSGSTVGVDSGTVSGGIGAARVNLPTITSQAGMAGLASLVAQATDPYGSQLLRPIQSTDSGLARVAVLSPLLEAVFPGAAIDTGMWKQITTTMTIAVSGGFCNLNSGNSVAATVDAIIQSYATYSVRPDASMTVNFVFQMPQVPQAHTVMEWGLFYPAAHAAPTDGVLFRVTAAGLFEAVCNFNGVETVQTITAAGGGTWVWSAADTYEFQIQIVGDTAYFFGSSNPTSVQPLLTMIQMPTAAASLTSGWSAPVAAQIYNDGSGTSLANQLKISQIRVAELGDFPQRDHRVSLVGMGGMGIQGQVSATLGTLQNYANGVAPVATALSATTAEYGPTVQGGQFIFATIASAETDYIVFAYLCPIGTAALRGAKYFLTGFRLSTINFGAVVATTPTVLQWFLAVGSTAITLATADGAGTKAPRRFGLGFQFWPIGAVIGASPATPDIERTFATPLVINPGEYLHLGVRMPLSTATASQQIRGLCSFEGFWEA